jgi:hypothetical protein
MTVGQQLARLADPALERAATGASSGTATEKVAPSMQQMVHERDVMS